MFTNKYFRAIIIAVLALMTAMVAIQPQVAKAQIISSDFYVRYAVASVPHKSTNPVKYAVKAGDNLSQIAKNHKMSWQTLYCGNKVTIGINPDIITPGERLVIPRKKITCRIAIPAVAPIPITNSSVPSNQSSVTVVSPTPQEPLTQIQQYALSLLNGDTTQYSCLNAVIEIESGWNPYAENPSSGAYGIPQALPGSKMSVAGADWQTNADTQLRWMIVDYIPPTYGTPCGALQHEHEYGYY